MKPDDETCQWQMQKAVHEGTSLPLASQEDEERRPGPGLQEVGEPKDSEPNDEKDFNRSLHPILPAIREWVFPGHSNSRLCTPCAPGGRTRRGHWTRIG